MKKLIMLLIIPIAVLALVVGCAAPAPAPAPGPGPTPTPTPGPAPAPAPGPEVFSYVFAHFIEPGQPTCVYGLEPALDELYKRTNGRIRYRIVYGGALLSEKELANGVGAGVADMGQIYTGYAPELHIVNTLAGILDPNYGTKLLALGTAAVHKALEKEVPALVSEVGNLNCRTAAMYPSVSYVMAFTSPVEKLADWEGKKVRVPGVLQPPLATALGATVVAMPYPEIYMALKTGIIDGAMTESVSQMSQKFYEPAPYLFITGLKGSPGASPALCPNYYIMNLDSYNALPDDLRKIHDEVFDELTPKLAALNAQGGREAIDWMLAQGCTEYAFSEEDYNEWIRLCPDFYKLAEERLNELGQPGAEITAKYKELAEAYIAGTLK